MNKKEGLGEINKTGLNQSTKTGSRGNLQICKIRPLKKSKKMNPYKFKQKSRKTSRLKSDHDFMKFSMKVASSKNLERHVKPFQRKFFLKTKLKKHSKMAKMRTKTNRPNASLGAKRAPHPQKSLEDSEYNFRSNAVAQNKKKLGSKGNVFASHKLQIVRSNSQSLNNSRNLGLSRASNQVKAQAPLKKRTSRNASKNSAQMKIYVAPLHSERNGSSSVKSDSRFVIKNPRRTVESAEETPRGSKLRLFNTRIHRSKQNSFSPMQFYKEQFSEARKTSHEEYSFPISGYSKFAKSVQPLSRDPLARQFSAHRHNLFAKNFLRLLKNFFQTKIVLLKCKFMNQLKMISVHELRSGATMKSSLEASHKNSFASKATTGSNARHEQTVAPGRVEAAALESSPQKPEPVDPKADAANLHFSG